MADVEGAVTAPLAPSAGSNQVAPEPRPAISILPEVEAHIEALLKLSRQLPGKRFNEPETEGTVFRRFLGAMAQNIRHLKESDWKEEEMAQLGGEAQVARFAEVFHVGRVYSEFFGGGAAMSEVALQEFAALRAQALQTEQTLKTLYEHVQRPQQGRPLQPLFNFGGQVRGGQPRVFGAAAGKFYQEQGQLTFLNHTIRESEEFTVEKHTDALSTLVDAKWVDALEPSHEDAETMGEAATGEQEEAGGSDGSSGGGGGGGDANEGSAEPALSFAHLAHQFKTMCFSYSLLQASSISLNIYNMYFFFPGKTNWLVVLACIVTQVAAPFFLLLHQLEFMRDLWPAEERDTDPWATWDVITVAVVILLFDTINAEIFSKQIRNSLLTLRLRNVVWNSSRDWKGTLMMAFDIYANVINPCITAVVINLVLFGSSSDVLDCILNALALNFIIEVDEYVLKDDLDDAHLAHQEALPTKIVAFLLGDTRAACNYYLSSEAAGGAARKVLQNEIRRPFRMLLPVLMLAFAVPFLTFLALKIRWMNGDGEEGA